MILFFLSCVLVAQNLPPCFEYEPKLVQVSGRLTRRAFPGPPNYESVAEGDTREVQWLVRLATPACVNGIPGDELNSETELLIKEMQLVIVKTTDWKQYASLVGKDVKVTGTLFHAHTGHHRTPVLITVRSIEPRSNTPRK